MEVPLYRWNVYGKILFKKMDDFVMDDRVKMG
jgi:hypothetical protein